MMAFAALRQMARVTLCIGYYDIPCGTGKHPQNRVAAESAAFPRARCRAPKKFSPQATGGHQIRFTAPANPPLFALRS